MPSWPSAAAISTGVLRTTGRLAVPPNLLHFYVAHPINTVIKSGGRELHGGAYYFLRNEALNANEFFRNRDNLPRPQYRFNYPGYFLGGPVTIGQFNKS